MTKGFKRASGVPPEGSGALPYGRGSDGRASERASGVSPEVPRPLPNGRGSDILPVSARADLRQHRNSQPQKQGQSAPALLIPKFKTMVIDWGEWVWKEMREGGLLHQYLRRERHQSKDRVRAVARQMHGHKPNPKSDMRLLAAVPAREYFRWRDVDKNFWDDDSNLKSLRRDNPEMKIFV